MEAAFWSVTRATFTGSSTPISIDVAIGAGGRVEALASRHGLDLLGHDGALEAGVVGDLLHRGGKGLADDLHANLLVSVDGLDAVKGRGGSQERHAAAGDDALLDGSTGGLQGVLDAVLRSP